MAHFAKIKNGIVTNVVVAEQGFIDTQAGTWVQTSYNTSSGQHSLGGTPLRKNFAGVGSVYDTVRDAFYRPQPYPSWTLNEETCTWTCPVAYPLDGSPDKLYRWDESITNWAEIT